MTSTGNLLITWQLPGNTAKPAVPLESYAERHPLSLLDALEKASKMECPDAITVTCEEYDVVWDRENPDYDMMPCTKIANQKVKQTWVLDHDRAKLWDVLARHYLAAGVDHRADPDVFLHARDAAEGG